MNCNTLLVLLAIIVVAQTAVLTPTTYPDGAFFTINQDSKGAWWFVDPNNKTFWSKGVDVWMFNSDPEVGTQYSPYKNSILTKHGDLPTWADAQVQRALKWGVNTLGAWVSEALKDVKIPYTPVLGFYSNWKTVVKQNTGFSSVAPDLYDPGFKTASQQLIRERVLPYVNDPYLVGWYLDNEIHLGTNWWRSVTLFAEYVNFTTTSYAWKATQSYVKKLYPTVSDLNDAWGTSFRTFAAINNVFINTTRLTSQYRTDAANFDQQTCKLYFDTVIPLLKNADPNHLVLGVKWNGMPNELSLAVETSDVISIDWYRSPREEYPEFTKINQITNRPLLIGEYCYRGNDTGHLNTRGGGTLVPTQAERAALFSQFVGNMSRLSYIIGAHWFRLIDEPYLGRYDGENSNMGIVDIYDKEYTTLSAAMTRAHAQADSFHGTTRTLAGQKGPRVSCPNSCSKHGSCHTASGKCFCDKLYSGGDCSFYTGKISDSFKTINTANWFFVSGAGMSWYTSTTSSGTYSVGSNGMTMKVLAGSSECPGGQGYWRGPWLKTIQEYQKGWMNFTYKAPDHRHPRLSMTWLGVDKYSETAGVSLTIGQSDISLEHVYGTVVTAVKLYNITFNMSLSHNYALLWDVSDKLSVYVDNKLIMNHAAPDYDFGVAGFDGSFGIKFYMWRNGNCEADTFTGLLSNFNHEVVKRTCPNSCSNLGLCDYETGVCTCNAGYFGADCSALLSTPPGRGWLKHSNSNLYVTLDSSLNLVATAPSVSTATFFNFTKDRYGGYSIIDASTGKYVIAKSSGTGPLAASSASASTWESFAFAKSYYVYSIWTYINNKFVDLVQTGTNANRLVSTLTAPTGNSRFYVISHVTNIDYSLQGVRIICKGTGNYLNIDSANTLSATSPSDSAVFRMRKTADGYWTFQYTATGYYLSVDTTTTAYPGICKSATPTAKEYFRLIKRTGDEYLIQSMANNNYLITQGNDKVTGLVVPGWNIADKALWYITVA